MKQLWASVKAFTAMRFPRAASWFFGWGDVSQRDYEREVGDGLDHNVLVSPILQIASMFPEAVLAVRREDKTGKREILRQHPMPALVMRPNKFYTGDTLWMATLLSFLTDGNAYWLKVRDNRGNVRELWYVAHWTMTPKSDDESVFITHYEYRVGGTSIRLDPADVVHFREGLDPRCPQLGFSRLKPLIKEIFTDSESSNLVSALLKNKGVPGLLITPEKDVQISPQDETATKQYVLEKTTGRHRGEPLVLGAATKIQQYGFSPAEMDLAAIRNVPEERVCAMLNWPAALAGFGTGIDQTKVGATMKELVKLGWTGCLLPLQRKLAAQLTFALLPDFDDEPGIEAMFDTSDVEALRADMLQMAQIGETIMRGGFGTRADARRLLNLEVRDSDAVFYIPFSATEVGRDDRAEPPAGDPLQLPPTGKWAKGMTRLQARLLRARDRAFKQLERPFRAKIKGQLERIGAEVERAYLNVAKSEDDALRIELVLSQLDFTKIASDMRAIFGAQYVAVYKNDLETLAGLGIGVNLPDHEQIEVLAQGGLRSGLLDLAGNARKRALDVLAQSREEGLGIPETAARLRDLVPSGRFNSVDARAELIARTETRFAQTQSALRAYGAMDGVSSVMIIDGRLGATDAECEALNGQVVSFEEAQRLLEDEHPNGTRDLVPVFEEA